MLIPWKQCITQVEDFALLSFKGKPIYIGVDDGRSKVGCKYALSLLMPVVSLCNIDKVHGTGYCWRVAAGLLYCSKQQEISCFVCFSEEESVQKDYGFLFFLQLCQISCRAFKIHPGWLFWYPWKAKAAKTDHHLFWLLQSREGNPIVYWCCCSWARHSCCRKYFKFHFSYHVPVFCILSNLNYDVSLLSL